MKTTKPTLAKTGLATLVLFGAVALSSTAAAEAQKAPGKRHRTLMKYDKNGDGKIGPMEKQAAITAKVQRIMAKTDKNGDGRIGPFEIRTAPGPLSTWLKSADANKNGFVTRVELRRTVAGHWKNGVHKPWHKGHEGKGYEGKGQKGQKGYKGHKGHKGYKGYKGKAPGQAAPWLAPKPPPPVINVRDHRSAQPVQLPNNPRFILKVNRPAAKVYALKAVGR